MHLAMLVSSQRRTHGCCRSAVLVRGADCGEGSALLFVRGGTMTISRLLHKKTMPPDYSKVRQAVRSGSLRGVVCCCCCEHLSDMLLVVADGTCVVCDVEVAES